MVPPLTSLQLSAYLSHISLPPSLHPDASPPLARDLRLLTALHTHHLSAVPYENLLLHYSPHHNVSIEPQDLFDKIITANRGRGGYCMENSILFNLVLRAMGFDAYTTGARIRLRTGGVPAGNYIGWSHIVNIVHLPTGPYMVDISFGGDGATFPLPLTPGLAHISIGTQEIRLVWDSLPEQTSRHSKSWIYQYRNSADREWNSFYAFNEIEWTHTDFVPSNWHVSQHPGSFQRTQVLVIKFLRREGDVEEGEGKEGEESRAEERSQARMESEAKRFAGVIYGKRMLVDGLVKENLGGKTVVVRECRTEEERVKALWDCFGITLTPEEREGIRGLSTELK